MADSDNTVTFLGGESGRLRLTVGVNQPFVIDLYSVREETQFDSLGGRAAYAGGYPANYDGMEAYVRYQDIVLHGECDNVLRTTVYTHGNFSHVECDIHIANDLLDVYDLQLEGDDTPTDGDLPITAPVTIEQHPSGDYAFEMRNYSGLIPQEAIQLRGDCTTYPLLYVPPLLYLP